MKKLMLLGGSQQQVVAIEKARQMGYFTVLCDYLPDNPGRLIADRFYQVSTTDMPAVLEVARREKIDGILAYASDPAAPTAAHVAEDLGLPGNPGYAVDILCNKDKFRKFLAENGFHTPRAVSLDRAEVSAAAIAGLKLPLIVKPVDSSGSNGVSRVDDLSELAEKAARAMAASRCGRIILEEYIEAYGYQVAGDGLSIDGELEIACLGDDHFDASGDNPFVPVAATFPCSLPERLQTRIRSEIQRLITLLGMKTCTYNFDIRIGRDMQVYLMEIAPRSGGNYIPQIVERITGVDMVKCAIQAAMGENIAHVKSAAAQGFFAYYALHSSVDGVLKCLDIMPESGCKIIEEHIRVREGDIVRKFNRANATMGILVMRFESARQMLRCVYNPQAWIRMEVR